MAPKRIAILGSTGSIGRQTLDVIRQFPDQFELIGLTAHSQVKRLAEQADQFHPQYIGLVDPAQTDAAIESLTQNGCEFVCGPDSLIQLVQNYDLDLLVVATVGFVGLEPTLEAIKRGTTIALANKEVLVVAGELVMERARKSNVAILPIDSEHNAIFQCLGSEPTNKIKRLILTASGGPFRGHTREQLADVTVEQALNHPTWNMGDKVTIDSATLMNKGLEVIEAHHLYQVDVQQIEVVVHPQSICHSMVEFIDGSIIAQLGRTDMRLPIQYCLTWPERLPTQIDSLDWRGLAQLTFEPPDLQAFPCLQCAYEAAAEGGTLPTVLNAADEVAVRRFLAGEIEFLQIPAVIRDVMEQHQIVRQPDLAAIREADRWARETAEAH